MKEADEVIVLYKGRLLAKGTFSELKEKGVFDSALAPLCKKPFRDRKPNARSVLEKEKNPEVKDKTMPAPTQDKELKISDEDRIIGGIDSLKIQAAWTRCYPRRFCLLSN